MKNSPASTSAALSRQSTIVGLTLCLWPALTALLSAQNALFPSTKTDNEDGTIRWEVSVDPARVSPGDEISVVAKYDIPAKWYIYAPDHDSPEGLGLPMQLQVASKSVTAIGNPTFPEPKIKKEPILDAVYRILEGKGSITRRYKVNADTPPGKLTLAVSLKGQRCDPNVCLPVDYGTRLEVTVAGGGSTPSSGASESPTETPPTVADAGTKTSTRAAIGNILAGDDIPGGAGQGNNILAGGKGDNLLSGDSLMGGASRSVSKAKWEVTLSTDKVDRGGKVTVLAKYRVDPGWHIYAPDQGGFSLPTTVDSTSEFLTRAGSPTFPEPKIGKLAGLDEEQRWLEGEGTIRQSFLLSADAEPGPLSLPITVHYMTCTPQNCLPDEKYTTELTVNVSDKAPLPPPVGEAVESSDAEEPLIAGEDLGSQPLWLFILAMIGGGLFALAMPCTYPMIPITISYFTKQAEARHGAVLPLALAYGAGIIVIFNVIGIAFAGLIQGFATHWAVNLLFCFAFVIFAFSLFGLYEIRLPSSMNRVVGTVSGIGGYVGVFLLGAVLVVSSFTCTAPVMGGLLAIALSDTGGVGRVSLGMTVFGATMAVPFVFLSLFPARVRDLPRSGEWLHVLKVSLGFLELAAAIKFFSNVDLALGWSVFPRELFLLLWAGIFSIGGLYILNLFRLDGDSSSSIGPKRMLTGLSTLLLGLYFFWGSMGYRLDWISSALAPAYSAERIKEEERTLIKDDIEAGLARAKAEGKPVLINFTGHT